MKSDETRHEIWYVASGVKSARRRGELADAERLQRQLIAHLKRKCGLKHILTAAALFELVLILEEQEDRETEALILRLSIRDILDSLPNPHSAICRKSVCNQDNYAEVKRGA